MVAAAKGYKLILVMPESMSVERRAIMAAYGAQFELTPREKGMKGGDRKSYRARAINPECLDAPAVENEANIEIHRKTTAQEILRDFPEGFDVMITGVGTGGHLTGVTEGTATKMAESPGLCSRTSSLARHLGRSAWATSDPGYWRGLYSEKSQKRTAYRCNPGIQRRSL
jgi:threonine dehydratase